MTAPGQSAQYLLYALLIGAGLGVIYGFLRPLRPKFTTLADGLFVVAAFGGWIYLAFGICACDIRLGYTVALTCGAILWEMTFGRLLRPVFRLIWQIIFWPGKKIFEISQKIYKFLLAILKKWVTIIKIITKAGGVAHGKKETRQTGAEKNQPRNKSCHSGCSRSVPGGAGGAV